MSSRDAILARIRDALRQPAPRPGSNHGVDFHDSSGDGAPADVRAWLPAVGADFASQAALFARNAADLKADFLPLDADANLPARLRELAAREGWRRLATHAGALTDLALAGSDLPVLRTDGGYAVDALEACDAGLTECEALVAQTGSVLISSRSSGGRALSVLPPHHVVVARAAQMVPDLPAAFARMQQKYGPDGYPSLISFITGPSRTGDIERILVLGAHGPKKLTIFLLP